MKQQRFTESFKTVYTTAVRLSKSIGADALLVLLDGPTDWETLKKRATGQEVIVGADTDNLLDGAKEAGFDVVTLEMGEFPVFERLTQALLESVANDILVPGALVVSVYSGFEAGTMDSISVLRLTEHLGRLTARDLRQIETSVPLDTIKIVVDLALEIGREGREGKRVGTTFVVGDTRKVLANSHPTGFDPVKGYSRKERNLDDRKVREAIKEIAQLDGAIIISADGTVEAAASYLDAPAKGITLTKGLGARHWSAAAITRATKAIAIVVSESSGTVRIFQNGDTILRIEPLRRPLKWKDFEYEPPSAES